jgi:hypothetical protein
MNGRPSMSRVVELQRSDLVCVVDDEDYDRVESFGTWYWDGKYVKHKKNGRRNGKYRAPLTYTYLHRFVLDIHAEAHEGNHIHHKDGNTLNNTRSNLVIAGRKLNNQLAVIYRDTGERVQ